MNNILALINIEFLTKNDALKNWRMLLFVSFLLLLIISSSHSADKKIYQIAQLNSEIKEIKSEFVETRASLMRLKMETRIVSKLASKGVGPSTSPPIKLVESN